MDEMQKHKAAEWFKTHLSPVCPSCGRIAGFEIVDRIASPIVVERGAFMMGGASVPMVLLGCSYCAHIRSFSAVMMGIVPKG